MAWFLVRRLGLLAIALLLATVIVFSLLRLVPGDLAVVIAGTEVTPERLAEIRADLGLDRPLLTQYFEWMGGVLTGDFGTSALTGSTVTSQLGEKLTVTAPLIIASTILALTVAVPFGVYAAMRRNSADGVGLSAIGQLGIAVPQFLVAMVLIALFAGHWDLPSQGFPRQGWGEFGRAARSLVLPTLTLAAAQGAILLRFVRSATLDVLNQDYMRTARAKGLTRVEALFAHGLRNASIPVVSVVGVQLATLLAGVVVIESVFNLPGVGQMLLRDIGNRDFDKVQGTVLLISVVVLVIGFLVDVAHYLIDPRLPRWSAMKVLRATARSWSGRVGLVLMALFLVTVVVSYIWVPYDPRRVGERWLGMSVDHWFGTDAAGKDLFSQVLVGARVSLFVAVASALIAGVVGVALGVTSAITPRLVGESVAYFIDVLIALPTLVLALVLVGLFKGSLITVSLAIGVSSGVVLARILRAEAASVLARDYILAAQASGTSTWRTVRRHVIPNIAPIVIVQVSLIAALAILAEAALSFLGVMSRSRPSWGQTLGELQPHVTLHPGAVVFPGLFLVAATLGLNLLGDGLRDATDPRLRSDRGGALPAGGEAMPDTAVVSPLVGTVPTTTGVNR